MIAFDHNIQGGSNCLRGAQLLRHQTANETAAAALDEGQKISHDEFHSRLGHH